MSRIQREKRTVAAMMEIYCRAHHGTKGSLCEECLGLEAYAVCRLDRCPFGDQKSTCAHCLVHCYKPDMRERTKVVMRFAGPRMLWKDPVMAIRHLIDSRRGTKPLSSDA